MRAAPQILHPPLRPLVATRPMQIVEIDFAGPHLPDIITGHRYNLILKMLHIYFIAK